MRLMTTTLAAMAAAGSALAFPDYSKDDNAYLVAANPSGTLYWMLADTVEANGTMVRLWVHLDLREHETMQAHDAKQMVGYDCDLKTVKVFGTYTYDYDGSVLGSVGPQETQHVPPGTVASDIARYACAYAGLEYSYD